MTNTRLIGYCYKLQSSITILSQPSSPAVGACTPAVGACTPAVGACTPAVRACTPAGGLVRGYSAHHREVWNQCVRALQGILHRAPVKYACHQYKDACALQVSIISFTYVIQFHRIAFLALKLPRILN